MSKVLKDVKSVKVWFLLFCCYALWKEKLTGMEFVAAAGGTIASRTINERRFEKDSA